MGITHSFVSGKSDGSDTSLVKPSDWNAAHVIGDGTMTLDAAANVGTITASDTIKFTMGSLNALVVTPTAWSGSVTTYAFGFGDNGGGEFFIQKSSNGTGALGFFSFYNGSGSYGSFISAFSNNDTGGAEETDLGFSTWHLGAQNVVLYLASGVQLGNSPTGGDKGLGTLNMVAGVYENGVRVTPGVYGKTTGAGTPTLTAGSFNMTSITDAGTGRLTVTIATDFSDANYIVVTEHTTTDSTTAARITSVNAKAAGSFESDTYSATTPTLADAIVGNDWVAFGART